MLLKSYTIFVVAVGLVASQSPKAEDCNTGDSKTTSCSEGDIVPLTDRYLYCQWYCQCTNGTYEPYKCYLDRYYDANTRLCVVSQNVCPAPPPGECKNGQNIPTSGDEDKKCLKNYLSCKDGKWTSATCGLSSYFSVKNSDCEYSISCWF